MVTAAKIAKTVEYAVARKGRRDEKAFDYSINFAFFAPSLGSLRQCSYNSIRS